MQFTSDIFSFEIEITSGCFHEKIEDISSREMPIGSYEEFTYPDILYYTATLTILNTDNYSFDDIGAIYFNGDISSEYYAGSILGEIQYSGNIYDSDNNSSYTINNNSYIFTDNFNREVFWNETNTEGSLNYNLEYITQLPCKIILSCNILDKNYEIIDTLYCSQSEKEYYINFNLGNCSPHVNFKQSETEMIRYNNEIEKLATIIGQSLYGKYRGYISNGTIDNICYNSLNIEEDYDTEITSIYAITLGTYNYFIGGENAGIRIDWAGQYYSSDAEYIENLIEERKIATSYLFNNNEIYNEIESNYALLGDNLNEFVTPDNITPYYQFFDNASDFYTLKMQTVLAPYRGWISSDTSEAFFVGQRGFGGIFQVSELTSNNDTIQFVGGEDSLKQFIRPAMKIKVPNTQNYYLRNLIEFGQSPIGLSEDLRPIKWLVLDKQENINDNTYTYTIITQDSIEYMYFDESQRVISWEFSSCREWLNNDFYNSYFTNEEISFIQLTNHESKHLNIQGVVTTTITQDYIYLLNTDEIQQYFNNLYEAQARFIPYLITKYNPNNANNIEPFFPVNIENEYLPPECNRIFSIGFDRSIGKIPLHLNRYGGVSIGQPDENTNGLECYYPAFFHNSIEGTGGSQILWINSDMATIASKTIYPYYHSIPTKKLDLILCIYRPDPNLSGSYASEIMLIGGRPGYALGMRLSVSRTNNSGGGRTISFNFNDYDELESMAIGACTVNGATHNDYCVPYMIIRLPSILGITMTEYNYAINMEHN